MVSLLGRYDLIQSHRGKVPESRPLAESLMWLPCYMSHPGDMKHPNVSGQSPGASGHWYPGKRSHGGQGLHDTQMVLVSSSPMMNLTPSPKFHICILIQKRISF